jgi:polysaccharide biosynthesis protein PslH
MKILFTTPILQHPAAGGPYLRIENSIKALSLISDLYMYCRIPLVSIGGEESLSFYKKYFKAFYFAPFSMPGVALFTKRVINLLSRIILKRNMFVVDMETERNFQDILKTADSIKADIIWLGYGNISYPLLKYIKEHSNYKVVLDTDSVWSRFVLRGLPYAKSEEERKKIDAEGQAKKEEERWGTRLADVTTAVSEIDLEYYQYLIEDKGRVKVFSNVIDTSIYEGPSPMPENFKKPCIYLAGTFGPKSPMDDAARWTIEKVMPLIKKKMPDIHFYIAGAGSDKTLSDIKDPDITITGKLPSVLPYLKNADVVLVPLRFESGTRFKILEAGACGIPIVSTTLGAEGIPVLHEKDIMIADTPEDFATSIIWILRNKEKAQELAGNCRKLIEEKYSLEAARKEAEEILNYLLD